MKSICTTLICIIPYLLFSQSFCGSVKYSQVQNLGLPITERYILRFDQDEALAMETGYDDVQGDNKTTESENERGDVQRTNVTVVPRTNKTPKFYYNSKDGFYFRDNFSDTVMLVKESLPENNWEIHNDTKEIGNFQCQKATTTFRGRSYVAWFAKDIPVPYGPWKFQGLGGLILEIYDADKVLHIQATSIALENNQHCALGASAITLDEAMTIEEYLDKKGSLINDTFAKLASKYPKGTVMPKWDKNCEDCNNRLEKSFNFK